LRIASEFDSYVITKPGSKSRLKCLSCEDRQIKKIDDTRTAGTKENETGCCQI